MESLEDRRLLATYTGDGGPIADNSTVIFPYDVAESFSIGDVNVMLDIDHSRDEDLDVFLVAPDGTRVELFTDVGGRNNNFTDTFLDDEATSSIAAGTAPFKDSYRPEGSLASFDGGDSQGTWTLEITDDKRKETGTLNSWSFEIESSGIAPFTVVLMPDTQFYSATYPEQFIGQTQWVVDHVDTKNLSFLSQVGDVVQHGGGTIDDDFNELEWTRADTAMDILDGNPISNPDGLIPYSVVPGNHDFDIENVIGSADRFIDFFGPSRYGGKSWYGGNSPDETSFYQIFNAGGRDFLHMGLEWSPQPSAITWAQGVLDAHPDIPVILATHIYLAPTGRSVIGEAIFQDLVKSNKQIFLVLSGHYPNGENHQLSQNDFGSDVIEILADYQNRANGGDGWLQLLKFLPEGNRIDVRTYSPTLDQFETDSNSQFSIDIDFDQRFDFPSPQFSIADVMQLEGADGTSTQFNFTVTRSFGTAGDASVNWTTADNTAFAGEDYVGGSGQLNFADGVTEQTVTISVIGDDVEESDEEFSLVLSLPVGAAIDDGTGTGIILDDDTPLPPSNDALASSEQNVSGMVGGTLAALNTIDGTIETITEELYARNKRSRLEHIWTFNGVATGDNVDLIVDASHNSTTETFEWSYSIDGSSWTTLGTVEDGSSFALPSNLSNTFQIRVIDTNRSQNEKTLDTLTIDQMLIRTTTGSSMTTTFASEQQAEAEPLDRLTSSLAEARHRRGDRSATDAFFASL